MSVMGAQTREMLSDWLISELVALQQGQELIISKGIVTGQHNEDEGNGEDQVPCPQLCNPNPAFVTSCGEFWGRKGSCFGLFVCLLK